MTELDGSRTAGELAADDPAAVRLFERLGIDYCCGGKRTLSDICAGQQLSIEELAGMLRQEREKSTPDLAEGNWNEATLGELCDHIVETHHAYLRRELPRLTGLIDKVISAHAAGHPELITLRQVFADLRAELEPHMMKEENILFPACREIGQPDGLRRFPRGFIAGPIRVMESEHHNAGSALEKLSSITGAYTAPGDACPSYTELYRGLAALELDLHQHIHKENNILFPRALTEDSCS